MTQITLVILFVLISFFLIKNVRVKYNPLVIAILCLIVALFITGRPTTMADYTNYKDAFVYNEGLRFEPAFHIIRYVAMPLGGYLAGFFLYALITVTIRFHYVSEFKELLWGILLVYISNIIITQDMVAMRAAGAGAFLLAAVHYKTRNEILKMVTAIVLAIMFHYTAITFLVLLLMSDEKPRRVLYLSLIGISYLMAMNGLYLSQGIGLFSFVGNFFTLFDAYVAEMDYQPTTMNIFNMLQMGHLLVCVSCWMFVDKIREYNKMGLLALKLYTIGLCCIPWFAQSFSMAIRFSELFFVMEIILIPIGFKVMFKKEHIGRWVLVLYSAIIFYIRMTDVTYWDPNKL